MKQVVHFGIGVLLAISDCTGAQRLAGGIGAAFSDSKAQQAVFGFAAHTIFGTPASSQSSFGAPTSCVLLAPAVVMLL